MKFPPDSGDVAFWFLCAIIAMFALIKLWPTIARTVSTGSAIGGLPDLVKAVEALTDTVNELVDRPANMGIEISDKVDALACQIETIHHEVTPNDGGSIKDSVKRLEKSTQRIEAAQQEQVRDMGGIREELRAGRDRMDKHLEQK